ncbi:Espin [Orbilia brochopaga]|nr:Espin [Drechslerella brochopaga]
MQAFLCISGHEDNGISRNYEGQTPLMVAAASLHPSADDVVFYLANEFDKCVNWRDKSGMSALMLAAKAGNDANINILLDSGADINAVDPLGNTSLHFASAYGHLKAIRTLIDRGCSFDHRNRKGWNAKDYSFTKAAEQYFKTLIDGVAIKNMTLNPSTSSSFSNTGNIASFAAFPGGSSSGSGSAPGSRDGSSRRPGTAGSFSYGSSTAASTTATLVPSITSAFGGNMGIGISIPSSVASLMNPGTPVDELPPPIPPQRVLKSAASMVEFSRMDRGNVGAGRPATPGAPGGSSSGAETSSPAAPTGARHSATGSVSSYASGSSVGSTHGVATGFGLPLMLPTGQQGGQQGHARSLYDPFGKLRPRASSNT